MERQNFCQKLYGIKQKAFRATFVNRWSSGVIRVVPSFYQALLGNAENFSTKALAIKVVLFVI